MELQRNDGSDIECNHDDDVDVKSMMVIITMSKMMSLFGGLLAHIWWQCV